MRRLVVLVLAAVAAPAAGAHAAPRLTASPRSSLVDAAVHVRLTGVRPGARVTIASHEGSWTGRGVFRADAHGVVDLRRARSTGGTYHGRDAMGLFWSMSTSEGDGAGRPGNGGTVRLLALVDGRVVASTSVERRMRARSVTVRPESLAENRFVGRYFAPTGRGPFTPVLVVGGSGGGLASTTYAGLLASHGLAALSIAYFGQPGLPRSLVRIPLEYFVRAVRWLDRQPGVDPGRLVVSGVSYGSEPALLLGADFPRLVHGVVALAPSALVTNGLPVPRRQAGQVAAWTVGGKPLPFPSPIPVEKIRGPIFLAAGAADALWPSYSYEQQIVARLNAHGRHDVTALSYGDAGHDVGFAVPNVPLYTTERSRYGTLDLGGSRPADAHARADLWPKLLRFLCAVR